MNETLIKKTAWHAACIAISSRLVGSAFRCLETLNPDYQQSRVISDPKSVCIREFSALSMAFVFSLITSILISPRAKARGWSDTAIQFLTTVIGTTIAESIGRLVAYRKAALKSQAHSVTTIPQPLAVYQYVTLPPKPMATIPRNTTPYMPSSLYSPYPFH